MIYMDNAATTRMHPLVVKAMLPYMNDRYGNPSGVYELSKGARNAVEEARCIIADTINALPEEIYFTSGGTESDNWALKMVCGRNRGNHIITSSIEHNAILKTCEVIEGDGVAVSTINPDEDGIIDCEAIKRCITPDTALISIMAANNEIGTVQRISEIGRIAREYGVLFHTDAVQAYTNINIDVKSMNINMLSASGHKIKGPKGVGFLYIDNEVVKKALITGGSQEHGMRAGTENVAGIVGLAKAAQIAESNRLSRTDYVTKMRDYMIKRVLGEIKDVRLNGHSRRRLPGNMNFSFCNVNGPQLIKLLDRQGICASAGSACSSASAKPSHVLKAIGLSDELARGSVRFSISESITRREIDYVMECLKKNVSGLRNCR